MESRLRQTPHSCDEEIIFGWYVYLGEGMLFNRKYIRQSTCDVKSCVITQTSAHEAPRLLGYEGPISVVDEST